MIKCISLFSGGLDSILATRLMMDQGLDVEAMTLVNDFHPRGAGPGEDSIARRMARQIGVRLHEVYEPERFLDMLRNPTYGYGRNINPCIDCRIFLLALAKNRMAETGARFIVTGEVVGERPMSQRRETMRLIVKRSSLDGLVLRPLSAKLLEPTIPEIEGWVDREKLLDIHGRSRKPQMALAEQLGIKEYPSPAGGCLLTDPGFAARVREMMAVERGFTSADVHLLKYGRHFRLPGGARAIVGRNEEENEAITAAARPDDLLFNAVNYSGPMTLLRGATAPEDVQAAAALTARYGKGRDAERVVVQARRADGADERLIDTAPVDEAAIAAWRIG